MQFDNPPRRRAPRRALASAGRPGGMPRRANLSPAGGPVKRLPNPIGQGGKLAERICWGEKKKGGKKYLKGQRPLRMGAGWGAPARRHWAGENTILSQGVRLLDLISSDTAGGVNGEKRSSGGSGRPKEPEPVCPSENSTRSQPCQKNVPAAFQAGHGRKRKARENEQHRGNLQAGGGAP